MSTPLYGLVLVGGKSERMGRDKALLSYDGEQNQLERTASLLNAVCGKTFISLREEQGFELPQDVGAIYDSGEGVSGPLCGILSAMAEYPSADWLVLACDLPHMSVDTLEELIGSYNERPHELTAFRNIRDGLPEPLCAIYPSGKANELLALAEELGTLSPRKLLIAKGAHLIKPDDPRSLNNINTAEEYDAFIRK